MASESGSNGQIFQAKQPYQIKIIVNLIASIYTDQYGNIWQIKKVALHNKRGTIFYQWDAECEALNIGLYGCKKKEVIKQINNIKTTKP